LPEEIHKIISVFDALDLIILTVNLLLMIFARQIMQFIYHGDASDKYFSLRVQVFRAFNLAVVAAFFYYHIYLPGEAKGPGIKLLSVVIVMYLGYVTSHGISNVIHSQYGKRKEIGDTSILIETYHSRLINIVSNLLLTIIMVIAIVRILGFESWLEAGGVLGVIGVFLALTQNVWAPDLFGGLIMLNSRILETGDVIEFQDGERFIAIVHKTRLFHTELLNLVNNHRMMIRNSLLRDRVIHNLSRFASAKGLRERITFKIGYDVSVNSVKAMFAEAFETLKSKCDLPFEKQHGHEVATVDAGDFAVEYAVYYYIKETRKLLYVRFQVIEQIIKTAAEKHIQLSTPIMQAARVDFSAHNQTNGTAGAGFKQGNS